MDVGSEKDQSIDSPGKIEYSVKLAPRRAESLECHVACPGATIHLLERTGQPPSRRRPRHSFTRSQNHAVPRMPIPPPMRKVASGPIRLQRMALRTGAGKNAKDRRPQ
jgi:hypothetical protein